MYETLIASDALFEDIEKGGCGYGCESEVRRERVIEMEKSV